MTEPWELPDGWEWAEFQDVAQIVSDLVSPADHQDEPHIAPNHIESGSGRLLAYTTIGADKVTSPKHRFRAGQILYSKIRPYLCKAARVDFGGLCSADMYPITAKIDTDYLHRWMISLTFTEWASGSQGRTVLPKINQEALSVIQVPVPPLAEQRRIVTKVEGLTARSRAARAALAEVPTLLEQFRQSVLASAFRGDLTADWREKNPNAEPASVMLDRIRADRRKHWETKYPKKKYVAPEPVDDSDLPELPEGWCWAVIDELGDVQLGRHRSPQYHSGANMRPYLRVMNVFENRIDTSDIMEMDFDENDFERFKLEVGDILLNEGQSPELVGRPAMYRGEVPDACFTNTLVRFRCGEAVVPEFALTVFLHFLKAGRFQRVAALTVNIAHLGVGRFAKIEFPVPPLDEQRVIAERVFAAIRSLDTQIIQMTCLESELVSLDQSILAKAFRGELVPQDPADEPAAALLARIRSGVTSTRSVQRGRVKFFILLLLRTWNKPLGREMLERGLVLMLNADVRRAILGRSKPAPKRGKKSGTPPRFVTGLDVFLGEMLDDGDLVPGPEAGFFAEGQHGFDLAAAPKADLDAVRETAEAMKVIHKDKLQATDAEFVSALNGEVYELVS